MTDKNLFNTLKSRGLLYQCTDEKALQERLESGEPLVLYEGSDPTADSLHIGHCVPYCILRRFQKAGHKVVVLMGGATACVGDPSGKTELRKMLTKEQIDNNISKIKNTLKVFLDFEGENPAIIVNNADWFAGYDYVDFMREVGVHFNVNKMLSSEIYANRINEGGLTFFEMGYMLMQAYDFIYLNKKYGCTLQYGGADQWGNIVAGVELQRKLNFANGTDIQLIGATNPLLLTPEGKKMGKTEKGAIWIDKDKISAYDFYQGIYQTPDACVEMMFALFTDIDMDEARQIINEDIVKAKHKMAFEITKFVRGEEDAVIAQKATFDVFNGSGESADMPTIVIEKDVFGDGMNVCELCERAKICASRSEARRLIEQGGITMDGEKVVDFRLMVQPKAEIILKKGKKIFVKVIVE